MGRPDLTGTVLGDTYRVLRRIGEGSMGVVYEATHLRLPRRFAVKVLHPELGHDGRAVARFCQEAQVTSRLGHPGIVEVVDFNTTEEGAPYIIMELLRGEDLARRLEQRGTLELDEVARLLRQAGSALHAAHLGNVVHRDLKPQNLFVSRDEAGTEVVKVLDFGISKVLSAPGGLTSADTVVGTPFYMAPEQAEGRAEEVGPATDVFALGVILYQAITGRLPFEAETIPSLLYRIVHSTPELVGQLRPEAGGAVERVVERAMAKRPRARFPSVQHLVEAFDRAVGLDATAPPSPARRWMLAALGLAGGAVLAGAGVRLVLARMSHHPSAAASKGTASSRRSPSGGSCPRFPLETSRGTSPPHQPSRLPPGASGPNTANLRHFSPPRYEVGETSGPGGRQRATGDPRPRDVAAMVPPPSGGGAGRGSTNRPGSPDDPAPSPVVQPLAPPDVGATSDRASHPDASQVEISYR